MNLDFDEMQLMLKTQARDFIKQEYPTTTVREIALGNTGQLEKMWKDMAELGWMGIPFPEEYGGAGMTLFDMLILLEEMGYGAISSPYMSTMICGLAINEFGSEEQKREYLPRIARGDLKFGLALYEAETSLESSMISLKANQGSGDKYALVGPKLFCSYTDLANKLVVVARTAPPDYDDPNYGITLFITPAKDSAIICKPQDSIGFDHQCNLEFVNLVVDENDKLGRLNQGWLVVEKLLNWGALGNCAEMVGATVRAFEMTMDYVNDRVQYGKHIGAYQVQQHRIVDMWVALEAARNCFYEAAWRISDGEDNPMMVSKAKAMVSDVAEEVTEKATLVHGAMGLAWDYDLSLLFRRVRGASLMFGDSSFHKERITQILSAG